MSIYEWEKQLDSSNKSDSKAVKFLDRPQVLTVGVLVSLAVLFLIVALFNSYFESFWDFADSVINLRASP
jgi:hypothetical protein